MARVAVNVKAPDFELTDVNGTLVRLSDFVSHKRVLVVFNRGFT